MTVQRYVTIHMEGFSVLVMMDIRLLVITGVVKVLITLFFVIENNRQGIFKLYNVFCPSVRNYYTFIL